MAGTFFGGGASGLEQFVIAIITNNSNSRTQYVGNGATKQYLINFPYINVLHVNVLLGGVILGTNQWSFVSSTTVQLNIAPQNGLLLEIRRITPLTSLVTFTNGAVLTADDLNLAALQNLYLIQEFNDLYGAGLQGGLTKVAGYGGPVTVSPAEMIAAVANQVLGSALVTSLNQRITDIDQNATAILNNAIAVDGINAIIDTLVGVGGVNTIIAAETTSRIAGDTALASQLTLLGAVNLSGTAFVLDTAHAYVDSVTSLATRLSGIDTYNANNAAAVVTEQTARISGDSANATSITSLSASSALKATTFSQTGVPTATAVGDLWLDTGNGSIMKRWSGTAWVVVQDTAIPANAANIVTEASTRASGDSANASSITTLTTTVNGNTASIATNATTVNGLSAQYTVKVDVNGRVSGYGLASTATTAGALSAFVVIANQFSIVDPGSTGSAPIVPFIVTGGVVYMQNVVITNAVIQNAAITTAKISNLAVGTAQIAASAATNMFATSVANSADVSITTTFPSPFTANNLIATMVIPASGFFTQDVVTVSGSVQMNVGSGVQTSCFCSIMSGTASNPGGLSTVTQIARNPNSTDPNDGGGFCMERMIGNGGSGSITYNVYAFTETLGAGRSTILSNIVLKVEQIKV